MAKGRVYSRTKIRRFDMYELVSQASGLNIRNGPGINPVLIKVINLSEVAHCCMKQWRHKLSFLELCGHLLHIMAFAEECQDGVVATRIALCSVALCECGRKATI